MSSRGNFGHHVDVDSTCRVYVEDAWQILYTVYIYNYTFYDLNAYHISIKTI